MFFTFKNLIRHLVILVLSFALLFPSVWALNKSYYTTISKVNYWEEKQLASLLTFIVANTQEKIVKNELLESLNQINFFSIQIKHNDTVIIDKPLKKYEADSSTTKNYKAKGYTIEITKRKYHSFIDDYVHYIDTLFTKPSNLMEHRSLVVLMAHLNLLLILEILLLVISIKFRLKKLTNSLNS
jgi:hypothetical protein